MRNSRTTKTGRESRVGFCASSGRRIEKMWSSSTSSMTKKLSSLSTIASIENQEGNV